MDQQLTPQRQPGQCMGIQIPQQQHRLKKQQADHPDRSRTAKGRQQCLAHQRLHKEQQKRPQKNGRRKPYALSIVHAAILPTKKAARNRNCGPLKTLRRCLGRDALTHTKQTSHTHHHQRHRTRLRHGHPIVV